MKPEYMYLGKIKNNIIKLLWRNNKIQRKVFVKELNYARSTVYDNLVRLEERGIIKREEFDNGKRGRPIKVWFLTQDFITDMESELENEQMPKL